MCKWKPQHPALGHIILNKPTPDANVSTLSDGWIANIVELGDPLKTIPSPDMRWWPQSPSPYVSMKLFLRIMREGYVLPIMTMISFALLAEIYTTTSTTKSEKPRVRLRYRSQPIADFGICRGKAKVDRSDMLGYFDTKTRTDIHGQDPHEHYWLYFTSVRGEEVTLDLAMFTFNMTTMVAAEPYLPGFPLDWVPSFFREREVVRGTPELHTEFARRSILRSPAMHRAVRGSSKKLSADDQSAIAILMQDLAGRRVSQEEKDFAAELTPIILPELRRVIQTGKWKTWPETVSQALHQDPEEMAREEDPDSEYSRKFRKWAETQELGPVKRPHRKRRQGKK
jgi:hypothetical protein